MKITVVTVSFNAAGEIGKTLQSVTEQDYPELEYVVIDGGSTDGTQDLIRKWSEGISKWTSERDGGIYDGMNKGIAAATGDYVLFMNAGDVFADRRVVSDVAEFINAHPDADVVYGNSEQVLEYGTWLVRPSCAFLNNKMAISHQASFVRASLLREHPFSLKYKYASDFEQLSSLYLEGRKFVYFDRLIATVEMRDGATYKHYIESAEEMYSIIESRGVDIRKERNKMIRHKKMVRAFRNCMPGFIARPIFRFLAKHYKVL